MGITRNAIIMPAGTSSRFVPLSQEKPKGLLEVKGEILIERQIRQLYEAGIKEICIIVGYKSELFAYLEDKFQVELVYNEDYYRYNNTSSIIPVLDRLSNTYICSSDNYFSGNVFIGNPQQSYYSALYASGTTDEYCLSTDELGNIVGVHVGGENSWYMTGHVYFSEDFSKAFRLVLEKEYELDETKQGYWEDVYIKHLNDLPKMIIHCYEDSEIEEFDNLDELRKFDDSYIYNTRSSVLKQIANRLNCKESCLSEFTPIKHSGDHLLFKFNNSGRFLCYDESTDTISEE